MSMHSDCGAQIRWAKRSDDPDRYNQPLEFSGFAYIIDENGTALEVTTYKVHVCDPDQMEVFLKNKERIAELKGTQPALVTNKDFYDAERDRIRRLRMKHAKKVPCPKCNVKARAVCRSLSKGPNLGNPVKNPHQERELLAIEKYGEPDLT